MVYSKRGSFRRNSAKKRLSKRLSKRKTHRMRRTRHRRQRGRGVGFSATADANNNPLYSDNAELAEVDIRSEIQNNPDLKQMIDEITPQMPVSYSGPARSAEDQQRSIIEAREFRKKRDNLLLSWFKTQKKLGNNNINYNRAIEHLNNKIEMLH